MEDANGSPYFEKGAKKDNFNFLNINSYLDTYHLKSQLTRKIMTRHMNDI